MAKMVAWLIYAISVGLVAARSSGPPAEASTCVNLIPGSVSPHEFQSGNGTYDITVSNLILSSTSPGYFEYTAGMQYTGTISSSGNNIRGFLIQAWDPSTTRIGTFTPATAQRNLLCNPISSAIADDATLIHSQPNTNPTVTFTWNAPSDSGLVDFRFTIVRQQSMYFGPLSAASPDGMILANDPILPDSVSLPIREPEDYRITARIPTGCLVSECQMFAGIDTNEGDNAFLDIYLEGEAKAWVAVGFTDSPSMFSADVIGCNVGNATTMELQALDTFNSEAKTRDNSRDGRDNAFLRNSSITDGRISCTISREIVTGEEIFDLPLNSSLYLIYGYSDSQAANQLNTHGLGVRLTPQVSSGRVNPQTGSASFGVDAVRPALTRFHGILMWISWPVLAFTGMFFAFYMRSALPNGEWFQVHRALMVASLIVGALGFFIIFVAQYRRQPYRGLIYFGNGGQIAHFTFGLITMLIQIVNPLIALFRCHPGTPNRWIFNAIHGYGIGIASISFSLVTIGIGLSIFDQNVSPFGPRFSVYWAYVAFLIFYVLFAICFPVTLYYLCSRFFKNDGDGACQSSCQSSCKDKSKEDKGKEDKGNDMEMKDAAGVDTAGQEEKPRKKPSKDSPIRWIGFAIYEGFTIALAIIVIVLIAQ